MDIVDGIARPAPALAGLLEVRGLGIVRLPHVASARLALVGGAWRPRRADCRRRRDMMRSICPWSRLDPWAASAPERVALALDCALGRVAQVAGAFAA